MPRWQAMSGYRLSSATWCAACWRRTRSIGRRPTLLLDPASARGRRVAARPPRRAQRPITVAGGEVWDARSLAYALAVESEQGLNALRSNAGRALASPGVGRRSACHAGGRAGAPPQPG